MTKSLRSSPGLKSRLFSAVIVAAIFAVAGFIFGSLWGNNTDEAPTADAPSANEIEGEKYICSMNISYHPYFESYNPKDMCGFCGMELIPAPSSGKELGERQMIMSPAAMKLAEVETHIAERRFVNVEIPLVGKVDYDETRVKTISAWVAGRLDRLFVDYTGVAVRKGDHLVEIYSPELYSAQEELLQAIKTSLDVKESGSEYIIKSSADTVLAVKEKLRLLGLTEEQIERIETLKKPSPRIELTAPIGGIVIHKNAKEGMYVKTGTPIYTVADLSKLWVKLDAYESDLAWIKYGQQVEIRTESFSDRIFKGWISFIDPILTPETRTVKVRVLVDNAEGLLRPNMFVRATVKAKIGDDGAILASSLEGKWICPMHPEVVADESTDCTACGMDLVQAETLGYTTEQISKPPLVLPGSAVLITGKRALVYVRLKNRSEPTFEGREVTLGPRAGDYYIVRSGISEGDEIVVNGNFKIDSALQLIAKPSMMSPEEVTPPHGSQETVHSTTNRNSSQSISTPQGFQTSIDGLIREYYGIQKALAGDNAATASSSAKQLVKMLSAADTDGLTEDKTAVWTEQRAIINETAEAISNTDSIQKQRLALPSLTSALELLLRTFGPIPNLVTRKAFCPMAFDNKGAFWLQESDTIANPYFGASMLRCGVIEEVLSSPEQEANQNETH